MQYTKKNQTQTVENGLLEIFSDLECLKPKNAEKLIQKEHNAAQNSFIK